MRLCVGAARGAVEHGAVPGPGEEYGEQNPGHSPEVVRG